MLIDVSHSSDDVLDQTLALSKVPIILSHSGCKAICNHPRNIDDERLKALAKAGGVIQINAYTAYVIAVPPSPARQAAVTALNAKCGPAPAPTPDQAKAFAAEMAAIEAKYPIPRATFDDFMKHLLHAIQVAGIDHVGIGPDMDGGGGLVGPGGHHRLSEDHRRPAGRRLFDRRHPESVERQRTARAGLSAGRDARRAEAEVRSAPMDAPCGRIVASRGERKAWFETVPLPLLELTASSCFASACWPAVRATSGSGGGAGRARPRTDAQNHLLSAMMGLWPCCSASPSLALSRYEARARTGGAGGQRHRHHLAARAAAAGAQPG